MSRRRVVSAASVLLIIVVSACRFVDSRREVVHNSLWDGSVRQVKVFLQHNWLDVGPGALIQCGKVEKTRDGHFLVPCTFHGRSGVFDAVFTFDSNGRYVDVKTVTPPAAV
jgi:hypothetical protein